MKTNPQFSQISPNCLEFNCCKKRIFFSPLPGKLGQCLRRKLHLSWLSPPPCSPQCLLSFYITFPSHHAAGGCGSSLSTNACCCFHHQVNVSLPLTPPPPPPPPSEKGPASASSAPPQSKALLVKTLHLITTEISSHRGGVCSSPPPSTPHIRSCRFTLRDESLPDAEPLRYRCFPVCLRSHPAFLLAVEAEFVLRLSPRPVYEKCIIYMHDSGPVKLRMDWIITVSSDPS